MRFSIFQNVGPCGAVNEKELHYLLFISLHENLDFLWLGPKKGPVEEVPEAMNRYIILSIII